MFDWLVNGLNSLGLALKDGVASLKGIVADTITSKSIAAEQMNVRQMCINGSDGESVCLTKDQLKDLLRKVGAGSTTIKINPPADSNIPATTTETIIDVPVAVQISGEVTESAAGESGTATTTEEITPEITQEEAAAIVERIAAETASSTEESGQ